MVKTKLIISGHNKNEFVFLNPEGTTLGRGTGCDVVLDHNGVSRLHARIYQDAFGRWIIEDLRSHNGVYVDGQRVKAHAIRPGQTISILHFRLSVSNEADPQENFGMPATDITVVDDGLQENIVPYRAEQATILSPALMHQLNEFTDCLLKLSSPSELYSEACSSLSQILKTLVAIVRIPSKPESLSESPDVLACYLGGKSTDPFIAAASNLHFSKGVLEAVRSTNVPVMARSKASSKKNIMLTVVDESSPHVVFSARVNDLGETVDILYIDLLEENSPEGMFDFMEAVAHQINFVQKTLFFNELEKREEALRRVNAQLKEKDRIKDEYVSRVTHDIKGHLTAIQSCLHVAGNDPAGSMSQKQVDFLLRSVRRTTQLSDFVNELLNLTQMRLSGNFETAPFSLPDTFSHALSTVEQKAKDKSIELTSNIDPSIEEIVGNQFSITEMVTNLLFNAIKYTPENKTVHLEAKCHEDNVQIDFVDTGIGIPADEVENVFEEFFRASNAKQNEKDGSGLGLSIVKQIVERHKGKISVQSQEGQGTTFTVILPKAN